MANTVRATDADMLEAAARMDKLAADLRATGSKVGAAATAAASENFFAFSGKAVITCGQLNQAIEAHAKELEEHAASIRKTVALGDTADGANAQSLKSVSP
jgi:uncharacterized protein Yka (UPF0111/DUF47 family)